MILIIGFGNPLRGDDALGQVVAAHLARHYRDDRAVRVHTAHQLTPELAESLAGFDAVLLLDARRKAPAGQVFMEAVQPQAGDSAPAPVFSHHLKPIELLALARTLFGAEPRMYVAGVTATAFEVGQPLSPPVQAALPGLYESIDAFVRQQP